MTSYIRTPEGLRPVEGALPFPTTRAQMAPPHISSGAQRNFNGPGPQGPKVPGGPVVGPYQLSRAKNNLTRSIAKSRQGPLTKSQVAFAVKNGGDMHDYTHDSVNIIPRGTAAAGTLGRPDMGLSSGMPHFAGALGPGPIVAGPGTRVVAPPLALPMVAGPSHTPSFTNASGAPGVAPKWMARNAIPASGREVPTGDPRVTGKRGKITGM